MQVISYQISLVGPTVKHCGDVEILYVLITSWNSEGNPVGLTRRVKCLPQLVDQQNIVRSIHVFTSSARRRGILLGQINTIKAILLQGLKNRLGKSPSFIPGGSHIRPV